MGRNIETVHFPDTAPKLKRVAAYARVSSGKDAMLHSLSAQISEYSSRIQNHPGWQYAGVYADEAKTGTGIITCGCCGKHYHRKVTHAGVVWICDTYNHFGKDACPSKAVPEPVLERLAGDIAPSEITAVRAENGNRLVITTADGSEIVKRWQDRSRAESWTPEMKEAARQKALARSRA